MMPSQSNHDLQTCNKEVFSNVYMICVLVVVNIAKSSGAHTGLCVWGGSEVLSLVGAYLDGLRSLLACSQPALKVTFSSSADVFFGAQVLKLQKAKEAKEK